MRTFTEPSCRHLLRQPLIYGVPLAGLLTLCVLTIISQALLFYFGTSIIGNLIGIGMSVLGFGLMRVISKKAKNGWDQSILFWLERIASSSKGPLGEIQSTPSHLEVSSPDTLDDEGLMGSKLVFEDRLKHLEAGETWVLKCRKDESGARIFELSVAEKCDRLKKKSDLVQVCQRFTGADKPYVYSLYQVPVSTDPLWFFSRLSKLKASFEVIVSFLGLDQTEMKAKIESYRKMNSLINQSGHSEDVDSEISFEDASHVLRGLSRGDDAIVEMSVVVVSKEPLPLDKHYFCLEKNPALTLLSATGLRARLHRSHFVRVSTATDLIPNILDPQEEGAAILKTIRGNPLYFDPQDPRLDALHWLVSGATGTGKSLFVGLVLYRLIQQGRKVSVFFVDHKRSFKRVVHHKKGKYLEPTSFAELKEKLPEILEELETTGVMTGIELSDLPLKEKREGGSYVIRQIAEFLSRRESEHVIYIVFDECWKFLRHDPQGVEEAFREFRKFDAGAIAITQSVKDFMSDDAGQAIIQNADITVLLRQKEDVTRFQDVFDLNGPEMSKVKQIKKEKGKYSECLIKTPFLSRFGRLYPTHEEHELLRTDNLRSERVEAAKKVKKKKKEKLKLLSPEEVIS